VTQDEIKIGLLFPIAIALAINLTHAERKLIFRSFISFRVPLLTDKTIQIQIHGFLQHKGSVQDTFILQSSICVDTYPN